MYAQYVVVPDMNCSGKGLMAMMRRLNLQGRVQGAGQKGGFGI